MPLRFTGGNHMPMSNNGLNKLIEECGELVVECAKKTAYMHADDHWDGRGSLRDRIEAEMGDVLGAMIFVARKMGLNEQCIQTRANDKIAVYNRWDKET